MNQILVRKQGKHWRHPDSLRRKKIANLKKIRWCSRRDFFHASFWRQKKGMASFRRVEVTKGGKRGLDASGQHCKKDRGKAAKCHKPHRGEKE